MIFPSKFSLKVVGTVEANLEAIIVPVIRKHKVDIERCRLSARLSKGGKYTSFTATFTADSQEQLDNIYRELSANPQIIMVL
jgi:putative lipoic acid-binding regulatory protein